ncbi:MAG: hypothetical protein E7033_02625 [Akkermansiaceae bacterium]|nr:hypothetical protein [Akkermansiaceae bacterium]
MWQANKLGIIALVTGLLAVRVAYWKLQAAGQPEMAEKVAFTGVCAVLFLVGLGTYLAARSGMSAMAEDVEPDAEEDKDTKN